MKVWSGVRLKDLTDAQRRSIISSSMFLKEKFDAEGKFEKLKARLVAGGHQQDKTIYEHTSSHTIRTTSVFMLAAIAAAERRAIATVDVPGAYLNAKMPAEDQVLMRLDGYLSGVLCQISPEYEQYKDSKGRVIVKLEKALYGCVQSAKLWYDELTRQLERLGFVKNTADCCVLNRKERDGTQTTIGIHVDDMLVSNAQEANIDRFIMELSQVYDGLSVTRGKEVNYLGMHMNFKHDLRVKLDMNAYIDELIAYSETSGIAKTPAGADLFNIDETSELLSEEEKAYFHTCVAKSYYLAKRVRPEALLALSFLVTRVTCPTRQDMRKLVRLLQYLNGTSKLGLTLGGDANITLMAMVDASYGVHHAVPGSPRLRDARHSCWTRQHFNDLAHQERQVQLDEDQAHRH